MSKETHTVQIKTSFHFLDGVLEDAIDKYNEDNVKNGRAIGELISTESSGTYVELDNASHMFKSITTEDDVINGELVILPTLKGKILEQLGVDNVDFYMRGIGKYENKSIDVPVVDEYSLIAIDAHNQL